MYASIKTVTMEMSKSIIIHMQQKVALITVIHGKVDKLPDGESFPPLYL